MHFFQLIKKKTTLIAAIMLMACGAMAQNTAQAGKAAESSNLLAILLIVTAVVLAFVIWGMGQALITISRQVMEKNKNSGAALTIVLLIGFTLLAQLSFAQGAAKDAAKETINYGGLSAHNFYAFAGVIIVEIFAILFLTFSIRRIYMELLPEKMLAASRESGLGKWWSAVDSKYFTKAVSVEREADILLDHDYDGIKELDNSLPPWWKWGFIFTIMVAFVYMFLFHFSSYGKNPTEEYAAEMEKARVEKEIFDANNKDKIDEKNVPMADAAGLKAGQLIFETNCVACHLKDGGGNVGPNLTDDYWLHKGSLNDIYNTIKIGYPDKGMQAWAATFTPKEMSLVASYVKSLKGTKPATPKAPQGDLYTDEVKTDSAATAAPVKLDSAKTVTTGK